MIDAGLGGDAGTALVSPETCAEAALVKSYVGCEFWPTPVANTVPSLFDFTAVVANTTSKPADIVIEGHGTKVQGQVAANSLGKFALPWVPKLKGPNFDPVTGNQPVTDTERVVDGAYRLSSSVPVSVYQFNALQYKSNPSDPNKDWSACGAGGCFSFSNDASLLLPTTVLTGNARVIGYPGLKDGGIMSYVAITGTEQGTTVKLKLGGKSQLAAGGGLGAAGPGQVVSFALTRGEVVQLVGTTGADFSGTLVQADKPIQVISGVPCIFVPDGAGACDHIEESVFPVETLGRHYFVTAPTGPDGKPVKHVVRLVGNVNNTTLTYAGSVPSTAPATLQAGEVVDLGVVDGDFEVKASQEFAIATFMLGATIVDKKDHVVGDPSQSLSPAVQQYRQRYVFLAPDDYDVSYADIVVPDGASLRLDGSPISATPTSISGGHSVVRVQLDSTKSGCALSRERSASWAPGLGLRPLHELPVPRGGSTWV